MKKGLVLGKFMPVHLGHVAFINFAVQHCDELIVLLCYHSNEPIPGKLRLNWLNELYKQRPEVIVYPLEYNPFELTDASRSSRKEARLWANEIQKLFPDIDMVFSSEAYGDYLAEFLNVEHLYYDPDRSIVPVSSTSIRKRPLQYWNFLPENVRPYFVKKIVVLGSESTGKSTLAAHLAEHYTTVHVPEMAREIIGHTNECVYEDLQLIAAAQARAINTKLQIANKLLIIDTDLHITSSYAQFLFQKELIVPEWIEEANKSDLYLFLESDCAYVQDGTRLTEEKRNQLGSFHKHYLTKRGIDFISITGNWEHRFKLACNEIDKAFFRINP